MSVITRPSSAPLAETYSRLGAFGRGFCPQCTENTETCSFPPVPQPAEVARHPNNPTSFSTSSRIAQLRTSSFIRVWSA